LAVTAVGSTSPAWQPVLEEPYAGRQNPPAEIFSENTETNPANCRAPRPRESERERVAALKQMAAVPWKPLFWERLRDSFAFAGLARRRLAAVAVDLASPLRGGEGAPALALIDDCSTKLSEASRMLAFTISSLGTVELLAVRCMRTEDALEIQGRLKARAARKLSIHAYHRVASSRGHLGAAGRLLAATGLAVDEDRVAVLAAVEAAVELLDAMQTLRDGDATLADVALLHADTPAAAPSPGAAPAIVGASDAAWVSLGGSVPGLLLCVALSGALPQIEAAQAALRVGEEAIDKGSKLAAATLGFSAAGDLTGCYEAAFRSIEAAHCALSGLLILQNEAGIVFACYAPQLGLDRGGNGWQCWPRAPTQSGTAESQRCASSTWQEARELMDRANVDAGESRDAGDH
jgi:hypothetical protein